MGQTLAYGRCEQPAQLASVFTCHALRYTHASQLSDQGVDIVTISKRPGHAKPNIALRVKRTTAWPQRQPTQARTSPALGMSRGHSFLAPDRWQSGGKFVIRSYRGTAKRLMEIAKS
jgi:hypothetical protein